MRVLVVNAGSSSLKLRALDGSDGVMAAADLPAHRGAVAAHDLRRALASLGEVDAVGHRVVHGGTSFTAPVRIDADVLARLEALSDLAPLHQPVSLAALAAVQRAVPGLPEVACFDTAFHASIPPPAATYALPREWRERWSLRRYGFHGLSHSYCSRRVAALLGPDAPSPLRVVTCHLGAGASLAAVRAGVSVDTTMGFTPLEGLAMATRSGSVDPGLVLWLEEHAGMPARDLAAALEHRSGLLGLAGTADMREVIERAAAGEDRPRLAFDVYIHRLRGAIAAMTAALGGLDTLVFTGGVGENSPEVRAAAAAGLGFLGVDVDPRRNIPPASGGGRGNGDRAISRDGAAVQTFVIAAREDIEIAAGVRSVLGATGLPSTPGQAR